MRDFTLKTNLEQLRQTANARYFSEDGLGRLNEKDSRPPHPHAQFETTHTDNGILIAATIYYLYYHAGVLAEQDKQRLVATLWRLRYQDGIYLRNPFRSYGDRIEFRNSKDNYDAIVASAVLLESKVFIEDILNNYNPHTFLTPKQFGFYRLCLGEKANIIEFLNLFGGFMFNAFQSPRKSSEKILNWLRLEALLLKFKRGTKRNWQNSLILMANGFWRFMLYLQAGSMAKVFRIWYHDPNHAVIRLSKTVYE